MKRMVSVFAKTIHFMHRNKEAVVDFYMKQYPLLLDKQMAEKLYDAYSDFYDISLDLETVRTTFAVQASLLGLTSYSPPEEHADASFLNDANVLG